MATTKPRINVTLEQHRYELFKRVAALQGVSMSALVAELLEMVAEPMERVCVVLEAAAKAPGELKEGLRAAVDRAEATLIPSAVKALDQFDLFLGDCDAAIDASAKAAVPDPRPVTRGSTPLRGNMEPGAKKPAKPRRKAASRVQAV